MFETTLTIILIYLMYISNLLSCLLYFDELDKIMLAACNCLIYRILQVLKLLCLKDYRDIWKIPLS